MSIAVASVFEVRQAGSDTNGGGFVTGASGTDYSQQDSKNTVGTDISTTDGVANGTTTFTSATANFGTSIVGNIVYFAGGTGSITGTWRQVTARASTTSITIDASIAASTGMTVNIGGALASPGQAIGVATIGGNTIYIKYNATAYSITTATINVAGGTISPTNNKAIVGYNTTRTILNTDALRPTLKASGIASIAICVQTNSNEVYYANLIIDGNSLTAIRGFWGSASTMVYNCKTINCTNSGYAGGSRFLNCEATACLTQPAFSVNNGSAVNCSAHDNTVSGFDIENNGTCVGCLSYNNSGASSRGFDNTSTTPSSGCIDCMAYNNGSHGFDPRGANLNACFVSCIAENNVGFGFNGGSCFSCATYNNTGGSYATTNNTYNRNNVTVTVGSVFTNAASGDFSLNNTTNQGALLRATSIDRNTFPAGTTVGYNCIGGIQPQASGSAGMLFVPNMDGV